MKEKSRYIHIGITVLFYLLFILFVNSRFGYTYNWENTSKFYPLIIKGWFYTLILTFVSLFFSLIVGLILFFMKKSSIKCLEYISKVFNELMFGIPLLVLIIMLNYVVGTAFNVTNPFVSAVIILTSYNSAYISEIYRGGIEGIPDGQWKAAKVFGFNEYQTYRYIIIPQVFKSILPPLTGQLALLVKSTALLSYMAIDEFFNTVMGVNANTFDFLEGYVVLAVGYLIITIPISLAIKYMERKLQVTL